MDGSLGPQWDAVLRVQSGASWDKTGHPEPELDQVCPPEPEWSLSALQVALVVMGIIAFCELIGRLL